MKKVLIINGPNLNLLGTREPKIYGKETYEEICHLIKSKGQKLNLNVEITQSNHEGLIIDQIQKGESEYDCIILNAGAYSHYSIAIRDAISSINIPVIEVHISNIFAREEFRGKSVISPVCKGIISGFGINSYILALYTLKDIDESEITDAK